MKTRQLLLPPPLQADVRTVGGECLRWQLGADAEALSWLPATPTAFLASTEDGLVAAFDARKGSGEPSLPLLL